MECLTTYGARDVAASLRLHILLSALREPGGMSFRMMVRQKRTALEGVSPWPVVATTHTTTRSRGSCCYDAVRIPATTPPCSYSSSSAPLPPTPSSLAYNGVLIKREHSAVPAVAPSLSANPLRHLLGAACLGGVQHEQSPPIHRAAPKTDG